MRTVVISGGTRGIGGALADGFRRTGDEVIALGSADGDLSSVRQTRELIGRLPPRIDVLVLAAGRFSTRRVETPEGLEQTFAIGVLARHLLAEGLRPALNRSELPVVVNLCGTAGIPAGRLHWDDLQLTRGYRMFTATMQGARANDLLGAGFVAREPDGPIRYVLYNPLFVNSGMHRQLSRPSRSVVGVAARVFAESTEKAAGRVRTVIDTPPPPGLTAWRKGVSAPTDGPAFDRTQARRLDQVLTELENR